MISVNEAAASVLQHTMPLTPVTKELGTAGWHVLAEDVTAPNDIPFYRQSSMDGYAFAIADAQQPLLLKGASAAGDTGKQVLQPGEAMRVFTGASIPEGADTVIMQEKAIVEGDQLRIPEGICKQGDHVRPIGSDIRKGDVAMARGQQLTPPALSFLAAMGIAEVKVIPAPSITLIVTGNELIQPGNEPVHGKVFESSSFGLRAALQGLGFVDVELAMVRDDLELISSRIKEALRNTDLVLVTGGVSVGDHDHTRAAAEQAGVQTVFHRVRQKPGKPLYFGTRDRKPVFGLPGNPSSVLTCFYMYVLPCLGAMTGRNLAMRREQHPIAADYKKPAGITHFLKGRTLGDEATVSTAQESYKLSSFALANVFIMIPEELEYVAKGTSVDVFYMP